MKKFFKKIAFVSAMAMVVSAMPAQSAAAAEGPQMYKSLKFYLGGDVTGTYSDEARYAKVWNKDGYTVEFDIDNENVATVSKKGKVTPVGVGTATVTATFENEDGDVVEKACVVTVKKNAVKAGISDNSAAALQNLTVGDTFQTKTYRTDADGVTTWKGKDVITDSARFTSSNTDVFTVTKKGGYVKAVGAGEATLSVWAVQSEKAQKDANGKVVEYKATTDVNEYKVVVKAAGLDAAATGVKEITVNGSFAKDATFTVKKGSATINVATTTIAEDGKSAVLTLANKLTKGTYTVSCGDSVAEITVEDEKVASIVILDDGQVVTTDSKREKVYVHYDILNQYGESVRKNYAVKWTVSTGADDRIIDEKDMGRLTIPAGKNVGDTFVYGTTVIITGVHTSTGNVATVNASVIAGLENHASAVEIVGVTRKDTFTLTSLPAGFADGEYYLVFKMFDQMGYEIEYNYADASDLTFTSLSPLLIGSSFSLVPNGVVIDGETYGAVTLTRGIQTSQGGIAKIQVTSTQTGVTKVHELELKSEQILTSFKMLAPDTIIAEGDSADCDYDGAADAVVTIPYEAYDQNGMPITSFRVLYGAVTLSDGALYFKENNDGSASLLYQVPDNVGASKNVDIPRVYTSTVINTGSVSNITLNIKEQAVPTAIKSFGGAVRTKLIEGDSVTIAATGDEGFVYYDQYDREMSNNKAKYYFGTKKVALKKASFIAKAGTTAATTAPFIVSGFASEDTEYYYFTNSSKLNITANADITDSILPQSFEFALYGLVDDKFEIESGSANKLVLSVVDIKQVRSFDLSYRNKDLYDWKSGSIADSMLYFDAADASKTYQASVSVNGTLADGSTIRIPVSNGSGENYLNISVNKTQVATGTADETTLLATPSTYTAADFVDQSVTKPEGGNPNRNLKFTVSVAVNTLEYDTDNAVWVATLRDNLNKDILVGVDEVKYTTINPKSWLVSNGSTMVNATNGEITYGNFVSLLAEYVDSYGRVYGTDWSRCWMAGITVTVSKLVENEDGLYSGLTANNALRVKQNNVVDDNAVMIENAELGDTFVVTFTKGNASLSINYTVGADTTATFTSASDKDADKCHWR